MTLVRVLAKYVVASAALAALVSIAGCSKGGGGGGKTAQNVPSVCVLLGTTIPEGCSIVDGSPRITLGALSMGEQKTRVVSVTPSQVNGPALRVESIALEGSPLTNYTLSLFRVDSGVESPVTLPVDLVSSAGGPFEIRAHVKFLADMAPGAVGGVALKILAHAENSTTNVEVSVAIVGEVSDCPGGFGDCDGNHLNACETNLTTSLTHCGSCDNSCAGKANVDAAVCDVGVCKLLACTATWVDQNASFGDGCECQVDPSPMDTCDTAAAVGPVMLYQTTAFQGNIVPADDVDYIAIDFGDYTQCPTYHPAITLDDPSGVLRFDLTSGCNGTAGGAAVACDNTGTVLSTALTTWETACVGNNYNALAGPAGIGTRLVAKVYAVGSSTTCLPYTLNISNAYTPPAP